MEEGGRLERLFSPASVAVVGVSARPDNPGTLLLRALVEMGFEGDLYPVNPRHESILDLRCYPSISAIPRAPELVILATPPGSVPSLVRECVQAGVGACVVNTAGFGESGLPDGARLEAEILEAIKGTPMRIVGPNCMGVYSSPGRLATFAGQRPGEGRAGCVSQSGSIVNFLYLLGAERGVMFQKMVSSGNELDLSCAEFLEHFSGDAETEMVVMYLEEVREPRRFLDAALGMKGRKPLIVWKAGHTEQGGRAAASHTGAAAGSGKIWEAVVRQAGIVTAGDLADLVDVASVFYHMEKPAGRRVCVISPPGGIAVNCADAAEMNGLPMPALSSATVRRLTRVLPGEGTSLANPVDMGFGAVVPGNLHEVILAVAADEGIDIVVVVGGAPASRDGDIGLMKMQAEEIKEAMQDIDKPVLVVGVPSGLAFPFMSQMCRVGAPAFISPGAAFSALSRFLEFHGL